MVAPVRGSSQPERQQAQLVRQLLYSTARVVALQCHTDERVQGALNRVAKFDRYAGALGLLPRGLRLVSRRNHIPNKKEREMDAWKLEELSRTVFTGTFRIWTERRRRGYAWWKQKQTAAPKRKRQSGRGRSRKKHKVEREVMEVKGKPARFSARLAARQRLESGTPELLDCDLEDEGPQGGLDYGDDEECSSSEVEN